MRLCPLGAEETLVLAEAGKTAAIADTTRTNSRLLHRTRRIDEIADASSEAIIATSRNGIVRIGAAAAMHSAVAMEEHIGAIGAARVASARSDARTVTASIVAVVVRVDRRPRSKRMRSVAEVAIVRVEMRPPSRRRWMNENRMRSNGNRPLLRLWWKRRPSQPSLSRRSRGKRLQRFWSRRKCDHLLQQPHPSKSAESIIRSIANRPKQTCRNHTSRSTNLLGCLLLGPGHHQRRRPQSPSALRRPTNRNAPSTRNTNMRAAKSVTVTSHRNRRIAPSAAPTQPRTTPRRRQRAANTT